MVFFKEFFKDWRVWATIALLGALWLLSSCEQPDSKTLVCKAGQHDFRPSPVPLPFAAKSLTGWAMLDSSCWYNSLGVDNQDWNKLSGVYRWVDGYKNINSFILAWRPDTLQRGLFSLILYENIAGANVPHESAVYKVRAGEGFSFWFLESGGKYTLWVDGTVLGQQDNGIKYQTIAKISAVYKVRAGEGFSFWFLESGGKYTLWINGNVIGTQQNDRRYKTVAKVSAWFGGNRKAPHDMSMQMDF